MTTKIRIQKPYGDKNVAVMFDTETVDNVGRLALVLIEKWSMVAAEDGGEDSAGRAKARIPSPAAIVERAFNIAEAFWDEAARRGHVVALPDLNEINADADARDREKAEASRS